MIKRSLLSELKNHLKKPEISLIVGPRQSGKTTVMRMLQKHLESQGTPTLFLNYDIESDRPFFQSQQSLLQKAQLELGGSSESSGPQRSRESNGLQRSGESNEIPKTEESRDSRPWKESSGIQPVGEQSKAGNLKKSDESNEAQKLKGPNTRGVLFLDEIQRKENAGLFLKGLYDLDIPYKLVVSGSGSLELKENIHESLAGRKRLFQLDTLSFDEFVNYKTDYRYENRLKEYLTTHKDSRQVLLAEYMSFGGYPRVVLAETLEEKYSEMNEIYRSWLERDIAYLGVKKTEAFGQMIQLLADQPGQVINYSSLCSALNISLPTLKNYLWYAQKTFIIEKLTPFHRSSKREIVKSPVFYFRDLGMRNFVLGDFVLRNISEEFLGGKDEGLLFENFVFRLLWDKYKTGLHRLHFWRTPDGTRKGTHAGGG